MADRSIFTNVPPAKRSGRQQQQQEQQERTIALRRPVTVFTNMNTSKCYTIRRGTDAETLDVCVTVCVLRDSIVELSSLSLTDALLQVPPRNHDSIMQQDHRN